MRWLGWLAAIGIAIAIAVRHSEAITNQEQRAKHLAQIEQETTRFEGDVGIDQSSQRAKITEAEARLKRVREETAEYKATLATLEAREKEVRDTIATTDVSAEETDEKIEVIEAEIETLLAEQEQLKQEIAILERHIEQVNALMPTVTPQN